VPPYTIELTSRALKDLQRLPQSVRVRIGNRIDALANEPRPRGTVKLAGDLYRIRVGTYRILYQVDDNASVVTIARIRHRREAYRT
jgi:mRNA interferase RelE/StbE